METPRKTVRIPPELWAELEQLAKQRGTDVSTELRDAARQHIIQSERESQDS